MKELEDPYVKTKVYKYRILGTCRRLTCVFVPTQSSGIETLVEELCSRLKDLQSKQGERTASGVPCTHIRPFAQRCRGHPGGGSRAFGVGQRQTRARKCAQCVSMAAACTSLALSGSGSPLAALIDRPLL